MAIEGQGQNLSYAIGNFEPTFTEFEGLFRVLNSQKLAVSKLFSNGAQDLRSAARPRRRTGEPDPQLERTLQDDGERATRTSKRCSAPSRPSRTSRASRSTACRGFAVNADPLSKQLVPVAEELSPTLITFGEAGAGSEEALRSAAARSRRRRRPGSRRCASSSATTSRRCCGPRTVRPQPQPAGHRPRPLQARGRGDARQPRRHLPRAPDRDENKPGENLHYLRVIGPINAETLATYPSRLTINRNSPYSPPGWAGTAEERLAAELRHRASAPRARR